MERLKVNNNYEIITTGQELQEFAEPINLNSTDKISSFKYLSFYIRPVDEPIPESFLNTNSSRRRTLRVTSSETNIPVVSNDLPRSTVNLANLECSVCFQIYSLTNFLPWNNCCHYTTCCSSCISDWSNDCARRNMPPSCPLCRSPICRSII